MDYEKLLADAIRAGVARDYNTASDLLLRIISETDQFPQAYLYLGRSYHALGRYELAIQFLDYFLILKPDVSAGYFFLGRSYFAHGLFKSAILNLKRAVRMEPDNAQPASLLGLAYLKVRRSDLAAEHLAKAVEIEPENREIYAAYLNTLLVEAIRQFRKGSFDLSRQMLTFLIQQGMQSVVPHIYLATIYKKLDDYGTSLSHYSQALAYIPNDPVLILQRADLLNRMGNRSKALEDLTSMGLTADANQVEWKSEDINRYLAIETFQKRHFKKAAGYAKKVIKVTGPDLDMHLLMGEAFRETGSYEKAINHFTRAIELNRNNVESRYGLAISYWQQSKWEDMLEVLRVIDRIDAGNEISAYYSVLCFCKLEYPTSTTIKALQKQIRSNTSDPFLLTALGEQYLRNKEGNAAEKWFRKAIRVSVDHHEAYTGLLRACSLIEDKEKTIDAYGKYLAHYPEDLQARRSYIQLLLDRNLYQEAVIQIQYSLPSSSESVELNKLLAFCYRKIERFREAAVLYRQMLKEQPNNEEYLRALCFCLEKAGNRETSILLLQRAFEYMKPSPTMRLIYGVLLYKENRYERALVEFRHVIDESQNDWRGYKNIGMIYKKQGLDDFAEKFLSEAEDRRTQKKV